MGERGFIGFFYLWLYPPIHSFPTNYALMEEYPQEDEIMSETYAYLRVSTKEQNEDRQLAAIQGLEITDDHVFLDKESGRNFEKAPNMTQMAA